MTSWGPDRLDLFVVGTDSSVFHKWWDGSKWGPSPKDWENLGGKVIFDPVSIAWGPNRLDVFVIGLDSALYHKWWDGSKWGPSISDWERLGGTWMEKPAVVSWGPNRLDVFLVGSDRTLYQKFWNGSKWNDGFVNMGGKLLSAPSAVSWGPNRIDLFGTGTNSAVYHKWWDGQKWGPDGTAGNWENMGGVVYGPPKAVCWGPNRIDLFCVGMSSGLHHKWWDGSKWGPSGPAGDWEWMGGVIQRTPEIVAWGPSRLDVFVIGTNNGVFHKWYGTGGWGPSVTDYEQMEGIVIKDITAVSWSSDRLDVFVIGTDGACYHKAWSPSIGGWKPGLTGPWENLGGICISTVASDN